MTLYGRIKHFVGTLLGSTTAPTHHTNPTLTVEERIEARLGLDSCAPEYDIVLLEDALKEIRRLRHRIGMVEQDFVIMRRRVASAYIVLHDYDGYYDPETGKGNIKALAGVVDDAQRILNGAEDKNVLHEIVS